MLLTPPLTRAPAKVLFDPTRRFDEIDRVIAMFFETGGDGQNVWIKNNVVPRHVRLLGQEIVGARADFDLAFEGVGLAAFIERHHDNSRAITPDQARLTEKFLLAILQADGIHDRLALDAFESRFDHAPFRAVDHDRNARDFRFAPDQVQEARHGRFRIDHSLVHVHVEKVRAALDLLARHGQRAFEIVCQDQFRKLGRARDIGPLANHHETELRRNLQRLEPGKL